MKLSQSVGDNGRIRYNFHRRIKESAEVYNCYWNFCFQAWKESL